MGRNTKHSIPMVWYFLIFSGCISIFRKYLTNVISVHWELNLSLVQLWCLYAPLYQYQHSHENILLISQNFLPVWNINVMKMSSYCCFYVPVLQISHKVEHQINIARDTTDPKYWVGRLWQRGCPKGHGLLRKEEHPTYAILLWNLELLWFMRDF